MYQGQNRDASTDGGYMAIIRRLAARQHCRRIKTVEQQIPQMYSVAKRQRKRGALTSTPLSIHHIMLKLKCYSLMSRFILISVFDYFPVDDVPKLFQGVGTTVLIIEIICMFPYIEREQRCESVGERIAGIASLGDE